MLYSKEIEGLHDDGNEELVDEHLIFTEVFFGNDCGRSSKRCLVTGVTNFKSDDGKHKGVSIFPDSENSAITSQVDSYNVKEESRDNDPDVNVKRMKFSVDKLLNGKPFLKEEFNSSTLLEDVSGMSQPASHSIYHPVTRRLVESSTCGVTSSCYLLNQHTDVDRGCDVDDSDTPNHRSSSFDGSDQKVVVANKAIASPVSQESCVTKLLVANPTVIVANKADTPRIAKPRWKDSCFVEMEIAELSMPVDSKTDPRSLLRHHINCLLKAAGWVLGRRKRSSKYRGIGEYVYKSPEGRPIREFRRAWTLCGQRLFGDDGNNVEQGNDCNKWTDMTQFCSDLSNTLAEIKEHHNLETTTALAHRWYLLDPFANFVFIDKTYSLLKSGNLVKAEGSLMVDSNTICNSIFDQKYSGLFDIPIGIENVNTSLGGSETFSSHHDSDSSSLHRHKYGSNHNEEVPPSVIKYMSSSGEEAPTFEMGDASFTADAALKRKAYKKSKKISEIKQVTLCRNDELGLSTLYEVRLPEVEECFVAKISDQSCKNSPLWSQHQNDKTQSRCKNRHNSGSSRKSVQVDNNSEYLKELNFENSTDEIPLNLKSKSLSSQILRHGIKLKKLETQDGQKKSMTCEIKDDDLLVSAIIKNKSFITPTKMSSAKRISYKSKALRKRRSQKGCCRLLPRSLSKGGKPYVEGKWYAFGARTVLSWLINSGVVSLNEVIQYRNPKDDAVVKDGLVTRDGILCRCCEKVLSMSEFKSHAGFRLNRPCLNLFMESGKPFTLCQLEAWSAEYKTRKSATRTVQVDAMDQNDDSCGLCGDVGELICCDNCPSTFHQACLYAQELPEGSWYCPQCTCRICGDLVNDKEVSKSPGAMKCSQCEQKYHESCLEERDIKKVVASDTWFCGNSCQEVYSGLHSRIGLINHLSDGYSWTLLRCIYGDQKVHSAQRFVALKAECNLKLAVAVTIMEECFLPMVDRRTGIDMIPHVLYNWGSEFARLNYHGFHTVVLEKGDVLISVASIRIHGVKVAEMPLIATCSKYRRQGMCRRLMNAIEEMLKSFKVEKLVISAIPSLVETWTVGFGFKPLEDGEKQNLSNTNLMVFPGTVWLKKPLSENQMVDQPEGPCHALCSETDDPTKTGACFEGGLIIESAQHSDRNSCIKEVEKLSCKPGLCHASHSETDDPTITRACSDGGLIMESSQHSDINLCVKEVEKLSCKTGLGYASHSETDDPTITGACSEGGLIIEYVQHSDINSCIKEVDADTYIRLTDDQNLQLGEDRDGGLHNQNSNMCCQEPAQTSEGNQLETVCHLGTLEVYGDDDDRKLPLNEHSQESNVFKGNEK